MIAGADSMYFEGAEKRIALTRLPDAPSLRQMGDQFWRQVLAESDTAILSKISNSYCDAYILSESSLFVWHERLVLITCGNTRLIESALSLIHALAVDNIAALSYQRKSEVLAHLQSSRFEEDIARLRRLVSGDAYRIGHLDGHYHQLFHHGDSGTKSECQWIQMYHIGGDFAQYLRSEGQQKQAIFAQLGLDSLLPGFIFDDFLFTPLGYSLNAIRDEGYLTLHITPQECSSYVSIETNLQVDSLLLSILTEMLNIFNPLSWDMLGFDEHITNQVFPSYRKVAESVLAVSDAQRLYINHYKQRDCEQLMPIVL